ncbi:hypothetical protein [Paenibacillus brasilensis]|uniref:Uncharacterized protein n=1 Tax=Paenibacillus brasilensis TaxID=128574 RepID=A0ABU0KX99_9BACL|nr:hypothetical protein [Paenibacillus brasilensis]MDQ0493919.1 hypothetical protein [Paenibacillus brasilensis]
MASEKTPNLGLNQIDRTSPKTTYFDLDKYLDQNWRAVDDFAGDVNDGVNEIKKRLDTTERKAVTLEPGVQIVHAEKAAPFSLTGLSGRMLVNLAGRDWGSSKTLSRFGRFQSTLNIEFTKSIAGGGSLKITSELANAIADGFGNTTTTIKAGKKYIALGNLYNESGSNMQIVIQKTSFSTPLVTSKNKWEFTYVAFSPSVDVNDIQAMARLNVTAVGQVGYADALRLYEISDVEYTALASMTPEQIASKYPFVDSVIPVRNPYAIRYGENLLPSFYEWSAKQGSPVISNLQSVLVTSDNKLIHSVSPVVSGKTYTLSVESSDANGRITVTNSVESTVLADKTGSGLLSVTFTVPAGETSINVRLLGAAKTSVTISNPMLNIGSTAKPFKPREDSMFALQTDLYADPVTGSNADTVFVRDGQYSKSKNWQSFRLDDTFVWSLPGNYTGYKVVGISGLPLAQAYNSLYVTKFDGKILTKNAGMTAADNAYFRNQPIKDSFDISISSVDSGWGDSYTPTADEIKAYFMGWTMFNGETGGTTPDNPSGNVYNGVGRKYWARRSDGVSRNSWLNGTDTLPTTQALNWTPYQLVYQLATPTVDPIESEGQLTFTEGDNQVEVGTGIVLRERNETYQQPVEKLWNINNANYTATAWLKQKASDILVIYKNGKQDYTWMITNKMVTSVGALAQQFDYNHDTGASYSVTYLTLDRSPVVPFVGLYAANEKTLLLDLVDRMQQATSRVSVLENKKAEKDNQSWITPTLLNGVTAETSSVDMQPQYLKMSDNLIKMHGSIKVPTSNATVTFFKLPEGYRPKILTVLNCPASDAVSSDKIAVIAISPDGRVEVVGRGGYGWVRLDAVQFIAE